MYFTAKVEDGCIKIPEELLMFFDDGDVVDVSTVLIDDDEMAMHRKYALSQEAMRELDLRAAATESRKRTIKDMRAFFDALVLDPADAKYDREELHRRGSSARKHLRYGSLEGHVGRGEKMFPNGGVQEYIRALRDDDRPCGEELHRRCISEQR